VKRPRGGSSGRHEFDVSGLLPCDPLYLIQHLDPLR